VTTLLQGFGVQGVVNCGDWTPQVGCQLIFLRVWVEKKEGSSSLPDFGPVSFLRQSEACKENHAGPSKIRVRARATSLGAAQCSVIQFIFEVYSLK